MTTEGQYARPDWPIQAEYGYGQPVEKYTGEAIWHGVVVSAYYTSRGSLRYVVDVSPQGFQMIAVPTQLRAMPVPPVRQRFTRAVDKEEEGTEPPAAADAVNDHH